MSTGQLPRYGGPIAMTLVRCTTRSPPRSGAQSLTGIPQARDLAAEMEVNKNTVLRALRTLRDEGIIEMGRGRAARVAADAQTTDLTVKTQELIQYARHHGYQPSEIVRLIHRIA
jgi:DNA-binding transcriptional regulator YhcF (GntR family)